MRGKKDMFCKFCGNTIDENSNFCSKCGNKLSITEKTTFTPHPTENIQLLGNQKIVGQNSSFATDGQNGKNHSCVSSIR